MVVVVVGVQDILRRFHVVRREMMMMSMSTVVVVARVTRQSALVM